MAKRNHQFQTIRTEGAILPPDILRRIASLKVEGATPDAYHLPPGSKLNEAISQSWTSLLNHWQVFQVARDKLPESGETGTAVTNERWLLPLFKEFDFGRLVTTKSPEVDGRSYPIERFYNHTPIHLIGCKLPLDRRTQGARGAATASPHSMVQEFLNRSDHHLWAFISNGLQLRILRDNISLSRQTFVEFDLEAMMEGEVYSDFALLWLLCHQSRVESEKPQECWLEKWSNLAREQGTRVLNDLRVGVAKSIEALGRGFIGHPRNDRLREKLHSGTLAKDDYYRQLLRIVYRLLFLFVAEDRELLHPPDALDEACTLYDTHYSTHRLRELAHKIRGSKHADLWHSLSLVFDSLGKNDGCRQLGLSGLGSFLWRASSTADVLGPHQANGEAVFLTNDDLLQAVRELAYVEQNRILRTVDYRNLGSEELGSVYESLLELHPVMNAEAKSFELLTAAGNERKLTGSYYTPDSLVQCLLDSALDPVVEDRLKGKRGEEAEKAILDLKVCDPACGSGHFLIAVAHRMARHLARVRTGESEPSPEEYQHALRDVIGHCVYGVDINPMAVELCKVSLWMEAIEPGRPLSFLDHHIQCGNSLLGTMPALLARGIPDDAFIAIEGDAKPGVAGLKKRNKREREDYLNRQGYLFDPPMKLGNMAADFARLNLAPDGTLSDVTAIQSRYDELVRGSIYQFGRLLADTWCAAFVWKKDDSDLGKLCPTERDFRKVESHAAAGLLPHVREEVLRLRDQYQFFHWHLAFPEVFRLAGKDDKLENEQTGWSSGFDVVLGNPPWEQVQTNPQEFFAVIAPHVAEIERRDRREAAIEALRQDAPDLVARYEESKREVGGTQHFFHKSGRFPLAANGRINSAPLFLEVSAALSLGNGRVGLIVPTGIATDTFTRHLFVTLVARGRLRSLFDFENEDFLFPNVHHAMRFCLITVGPERPEGGAVDLMFFARQVSDLSDAARRFSLTASDFSLLNPNTNTCPVFRLARDVSVLKDIASRVPVLVDESSGVNPWDFSGFLMFMMDAGQEVFRDSKSLSSDGFVFDSGTWSRAANRALPLVEGKMIHLFDHRFGTYEEQTEGQARQGKLPETSVGQHLQPSYGTMPRYWVLNSVIGERMGDRWSNQWFLCWRDITNAKNERTVIAAIVPKCAAGDTLPVALISPQNIGMVCPLLANLCSFVLDYAARQKVSGMHLRFNQFQQLPVLPPSTYDVRSTGMWSGSDLRTWLLPRVLELTYTAWDLEPFARDCGYGGPPFRWDEERRFLLRAELDAAFFHLYGINRDDAAYILDTFPIVRRKDEQKYNGEYKTKATILEIYDALSDSTRTGHFYQTRLDPFPGPPTDSDGNFLPMAAWTPDNLPAHIHLQRQESKSDVDLGGARREV